MYCKKRNEPDGHHLLTSLPPKRLMYSQAQSGSSLDSEPTRSVQRNFADATSADPKNAVAVGKRCFTLSWRNIDVEECSNRSNVEDSEAAVSGVTFQKDLNLRHARKPDAESHSASVRLDSVCLNSKRLKLGKVHFNETVLDKRRIRCNETVLYKRRIRCNETDVDKHGIRCNESDADKHVTFICSRVQESSGNLLSIARQDIRENAFSSISCCGQSRDDSQSNSRNASFISRVRHSLKTSLTNLGKSEAVSGSSKDGVISPKESLHAHGDAINTKSSPPLYVLSSGRLSLEEGKLWLLLCTVFHKKFLNIFPCGEGAPFPVQHHELLCRGGTAYLVRCCRGWGTGRSLI